MERLTKRATSAQGKEKICCTHFDSKICWDYTGQCSDGCPFEEQAWSRLAAYEDICFDADGKERITADELSALVKARDEGQVMEMPDVSERDRQSMADFLHDCFAEWIDDPSVGLYGMTEGEAALANAIMAALTRTEAEAALGGGGDG